MSLSDFCSDNKICCSECAYLEDVSKQGVPVMSCKFLYTPGAYSGCWVQPKVDIFACTNFERKESM